MEALADDDLLAQVRSRPEAFGVFYRRYERAMLGYFMRRVGDPELAADLAAETFAAALMSVRRFKAERRGSMAVRDRASHAVTQRREATGRGPARRRLGWEPLTLDEDLLERVARAGADERAAALLERLPSDQAQAVRARVIDEQDYAEIAGLRCSQSVVRQRVSRGLGTLRAHLEEDV